MAYDERTATRLRSLLTGQDGLSEKKMFGGIGFLLDGNMCCGVHRETVMLRLGPEAGAEALAQPYMRPFDLTGRPMSGWAVLVPEVLDDEALVAGWVDRAVAFTRTLPPK